MTEELRAKAYKIDKEEPIREFEMQENGDVILIETTKSKVFFSGREFITYLRAYEETKKQIEEQLSEEFKKKSEEDAIKNLEEVRNVLIQITPLQKEVEEKLQKAYESQKREMTLKGLKEQLALPKEKFNKNYYQAFMTNVPDDVKEECILKLTDDEKSKYLKLTAKLKRGNQ